MDEGACVGRVEIGYVEGGGERGAVESDAGFGEGVAGGGGGGGGVTDWLSAAGEGRLADGTQGEAGAQEGGHFGCLIGLEVGREVR